MRKEKRTRLVTPKNLKVGDIVYSEQKGEGCIDFVDDDYAPYKILFNNIPVHLWGNREGRIVGTDIYFKKKETIDYSDLPIGTKVKHTEWGEGTIEKSDSTNIYVEYKSVHGIYHYYDGRDNLDIGHFDPIAAEEPRELKKFDIVRHPTFGIGIVRRVDTSIGSAVPYEIGFEKWNGGAEKGPGFHTLWCHTNFETMAFRNDEKFVYVGNLFE